MRSSAECEAARESSRGGKFKRKEMDLGNRVVIPGALKTGFTGGVRKMGCVGVCVGHVHRRGLVRLQGVHIRKSTVHCELFSRMAALVVRRASISLHSHKHFIKSILLIFAKLWG